MADRRDTLLALADRVSDRSTVRDAWLAKSFTDRLFVVELPAEATFPEDLTATLREHDLIGADEVYELVGATGPDFAGDLGEVTRYRFVDVRSRGELQSYVID